VVSDNGASAEGGPNGSVNEMMFMNGLPDDLEQNLSMLDELGRPRTYNHYPTGWAMAFNTPFKLWKRYEFNGRTSDPCIVSWPAGIAARGEIRHQYHHAVDLVPTVLDVLGVEPPETIGGHVQSRFDGLSMRYSFDDADAPSARKTQFYSMLGSRAIWHEGWKAVTTHPAISGWSHFNDDTWELYHTDVDRSELHDLAAEHPDRLRELVNLWFAEAGANQPAGFTIAGEGLCVGRASGEPVTDDYPGAAPWRFAGGTVKRVAIDVSGTPYMDLEREATAMIMRE
jgi:arylsulfatase A-like enzyme